MQPSFDPTWEIRSEILYFQLGPVRLFEVPVRALTLTSNPFVLGRKLEIPLSDALAKGCRAVVGTAMPVDRRFATMCFDQGALRYAARYGDRYVVDLQGSFAEYIKKFSKKSRGNLQRAAKKFTQWSDGREPLHEFRSPSEISAFRDIAVAISHASYKRKLGWGFQEGEDFARQLEIDAAAGRVRGYVLMSDDQPAAYVFCRIDHDVIVYKHIGYDERSADKSPGTTLLYLILQRLFDDREFRLLDFDGTEYYEYKEFFATRAIRCARVFWFRPRPLEIVIFGMHWILTATWRLSSLFRRYLCQGHRGLVRFVRLLVENFRRSASGPRKRSDQASRRPRTVFAGSAGPSGPRYQTTRTDPPTSLMPPPQGGRPNLPSRENGRGAGRMQFTGGQTDPVGRDDLDGSPLTRR
ncbi:MAG: GNAT family N-acetyltransferase [Stellaceae bacterium]